MFLYVSGVADPLPQVDSENMHHENSPLACNHWVIDDDAAVRAEERGSHPLTQTLIMGLEWLPGKVTNSYSGREGWHYPLTCASVSAHVGLWRVGQLEDTGGSPIAEPERHPDIKAAFTLCTKPLRITAYGVTLMAQLVQRCTLAINGRLMSELSCSNLRHTQ